MSIDTVAPNVAPHPSAFGLPEELDWTYDQAVVLGTVVVDHTLAVSSLRRMVHISPAVLNFGEADTGWSGVGVTIPAGWDTGRHPISDDANYGNQTGVNSLRRQENQTVLTRGAAGALALGLATWFQVGPNARVAVLRPNPDFDPARAEALVEASGFQNQRLHPYDQDDVDAIRLAGFDAGQSLDALLARLHSRQPYEGLSVGVTDGGSKVNHLSHDLVLLQSSATA